MLGHEISHLCFGGRIRKSGYSDFGIFNYVGASSILTWVQADTASAACPCSSAMTSSTFATVICDADEPCYVNTA